MKARSILESVGSADVRSARVVSLHSTHPPFGDEIPLKTLILKPYDSLSDKTANRMTEANQGVFGWTPIAKQSRRTSQP